jgi:dihydrolipoamide dehydrogenase
LQCGDKPVFLVGDANQQSPVLHEAAAEGRIAGDNAGRYPKLSTAKRYVSFSVVFSSPQIARIGNLPSQMAATERDNYAEGRCSFENQGRSKVIAKNQGILKVYARRDSGVVTGAEMFGPAAEHLGHLLAWAVQQQMTVSSMLKMPFYHPVIEEGVRTALKDLQRNLQKSSTEVNPCLECGPGT